MSLRYAARTRPGTMVSTWLNGLVSGTAFQGAGFLCGGGTNTAIDKFLFPSDVRSTLSAGLSNTRGEIGPSGCANSGVAGYQGGGRTSGGDTAGSTVVDKFAFADDSRSTLGTGLSAGSQLLAGMANAGAL